MIPACRRCTSLSKQAKDTEESKPGPERAMLSATTTSTTGQKRQLDLINQNRNRPLKVNQIPESSSVIGSIRTF
ncbi:hypothetical protein SynA15127_01648 [Synechococcus sp. A15-127]|nr:hypothetical protein SynA15127_01648 [Synechococcus sp. A15-127]